MTQTLTEEEKAKLEAEQKAEAEAKAKADAEAVKKAEDDKSKHSTVPVIDEDSQKMLTELEKRGVLKNHGGVYVEKKFDPNLLPEVKENTNKLVDTIKASAEKTESLEKELGEVKKRLQSKEEMEASEKKELSDRLSQVESNLTIEKKRSAEASIQLLKTQTAVKLGLPFNFLDYVKGESAEEIETSVKRVMNDFALQKNKFTEEELKAQVEAAAEKARKETADRLKPRGHNTEGAAVDAGHIYTRAEIQAMSMAEFKAKQSEIVRQQEEGLIK